MKSLSICYRRQKSVGQSSSLSNPKSSLWMTLPTHLTDREAFETQYFSAWSAAKKILKVEPRPNPVTSAPASVNGSNFNSSASIPVKLPTINLPTFTGNYEDWIPFSDSFRALIHQNENLTDIQKFHYLRSSLKDEAVQVIKSLELTDTNYNVAWELLEARFKNKKLIIQRHVRALFELKTNDKESAQSLRQLLDGVLTHMRALEALDQPTQHWDTLMLHLVTSKMHQSTLKDWETSTQPNELPSFKQLTDFLQRRCQVLETSTVTYSRTHQTATAASLQPNNYKKPNACFLAQSGAVCRICNGKHFILQCKTLINSPHDKQTELIQIAGLCFNCLRPGHTVTNCFASKCRKCSAKHHTLLHEAYAEKENSEETPADSIAETSAVQNCHSALLQHTQVLLSTAVVEVIGPHGQTVKCRALIDSGSQSCFMTETMAEILNLQKIKTPVHITGIDQCTVKVNGCVQATIRSCISTFTANLPFLVIPKITNQLPAQHMNREIFEIPKHVSLADPMFNSPDSIDLLLGQEIFLDLLCIGQIRRPGLPTLQKTRLGWIIGGRFGSTDATKHATCHLSTLEQSVDQTLPRFGRAEEETSRLQFISKERTCGSRCIGKTKQGSTGRHVVCMTILNEPSELGESKKHWPSHTASENSSTRLLEEKQQKSSPVLTQVEAVINSRPLTPTSNDPTDFSVLTPRHFLIGGSLTVLPETSLQLHLPERRLSRWRRLQQLLLKSLRQRTKWRTPADGLAAGTLVLLKEDGAPPLSWPMGRVIALHPGKDGLARVASVKTVSGELRRAIHKLCPLPLEH